MTSIVVKGVCGHVTLPKLPDGEGWGSTIFLPSPYRCDHLESKSTDVLNDFVMEGSMVWILMLFFMSVSFPFLPEKK